MWRVKTKEGLILTESDGLWPDLPADIEIVEIVCGALRMSGYDAYGFQRFVVSVPGLKKIASGIQIIGVRGDRAEIVELSGKGTTKTVVPRDQLTYSPALLRHGAR